MVFFRKNKSSKNWQTMTSYENENNDSESSNLQSFLMRPSEISDWLLGSNSDAFETFGNKRIADFFNANFEGREVRRRFLAYNKYVEMDKDRVRLHGKFYNNIYLGRRIFGPARKQVFTHTIVGGMERRFEIIDNQINYIPFSHEFSDKFQDKCRNTRIKCNDDTRVILDSLSSDQSEENFIHANYVKSPILFNDFIITQAPMENTIRDFWRMVWQEQSRYIFMLISRKDVSRCVQYWPKKSGANFHLNGLTIVNEGCEPSSNRDSFFHVTRILIIGPEGKELCLEHWQADLNNSENLESPLQLVRLARSCTRPTIVHDCLGVSRAACLVAAELCIVQLIRGPLYKHPVQRAVHYLRSKRPFSIETPMQYIFVHRIVQHFIQPMVGTLMGFRQDYARWLDVRSQRLFLDDLNHAIPAFRLLSPKVDPDLLPLVRHRERPEFRRELHANVGELPVPVERVDKLSIKTAVNNISSSKNSTSLFNSNNEKNGHNETDENTKTINRARVYSVDNYVPKRYPRGKRY